MTLRRTTSANPARHSNSSVPLGNQKVVQDSHSLNQRPALVTIQQNIRRTKSRLGLSLATDEDEEIPVGSKRKRPQVGNENAVAGPSQARSVKRFKPSSSPTQSDEEEEAMETEHDENNDEEQSSEFYLSQAPRSQLLRLRKDHLVKLYAEANITRPVPDAAQLTRSELAEALIVARSRAKRGVLKRAPTQRPRHGRPGQAPFTPDSDDNQLAKGFTFTRGNLRRNATGLEVNTTKAPAPLGRSFSLSTLMKNLPRREKRVRVDSNASTQSDEPPPITPISPPITRKRTNMDSKHGLFSSDDLTDVSEADELPAAYEPSPRRLRSRGERKDTVVPIGRHLPPRIAKPEIGALQEDEDEEEEEEENYDSGGSDEEGVPASSAVDTDRDDYSSGSSSPDPSRRGRQTQAKAVIKGGNKKRKGRLTTPPPEDDEDMGDNGNTRGTQEYGLIQESPRRLRSGKVRRLDEAGEEIDESSEEEEESNSGDTEYMEEDDEDTEQEASAEAPQSMDDNDVDDEVDLSEETAKSLARYRRYELVRLCESRNLDVDGTKPQLVKALLEWRDSRQPSSSGASTIRAPSTVHPNKRKPVLERTNRVHVTQPQTPPLSNEQGIENVSGVTVHGSAEEPELEFDLGTLGLEDREIPYEKLMKKEKIGSGGFKDVYSGTFGSRKVAIAEFRGQLTPMDIKELQLLRDLQHDNIVRFLGVSVPENTRETPVLMVSELCSNGDLFDYIRNEKAASLNRVLRLMYDIACGLEYLHNHKPSIIHRDCKSSNILITRNGRAKIADFGLAKVKQSTRSMVRSLVGTVNWQAPELWHAHPRYDHKVDVFSSAMVFWEILQWHLPNKKYPWEGMNEHAIYETVGAKRQRPSMSALRKQWCPEIVDLVERMWAHEPRDRPTMSEVVTELDNIRA